MKFLTFFPLVLIGTLLQAECARAIELNLIDDFESGNTLGWAEGGRSPNEPTNESSGGNPGGYLQNESSGSRGAGSKLIMFNQDQWTGNYLEAGVTRIEVDLKNLRAGSDPLPIRIALEGAGNSQFGSTEIFSVPADDKWYSASFDLTADSLSRIGGAASLDDVLASISEVRILAAEARPNWRADAVRATLGVDNIRATSSVVLPQLQAGDADQDLDFDQLDLVKVQVAAKYLSGNASTWGEGDWNAAPGGSPGNPPLGDGLFDQLDIVAALSAGTYLTGPYAALAPAGVVADDKTSLIYDTATGELKIDPPAGQELTSINISSAQGLFQGSQPSVLDGAFDNFDSTNVFKATFGGSFGSVSFGQVLEPAIPEDQLRADLSAIGSLAGGGDLGEVDLIYVPEPSSAAWAVFSLLVFFLRSHARERLS